MTWKLGELVYVRKDSENITAEVGSTIIKNKLLFNLE